MACVKGISLRIDNIVYNENIPNYKENMNYWDNPKVFEDRNRKIYEDKKAGMNVIELCTKYGISTTRVYKIVRREKQNDN